ncbi:MAG TPA: hypothetical protein VJT72_04990 [Pseudonocardiaceae bacterium]|nr:hypothetical protein [Pseudonocardiaceae bacterium]
MFDLLGEHLHVGHADPLTRRAGGVLRWRNGECEQGGLGERCHAEYRTQQQLATAHVPSR